MEGRVDDYLRLPIQLADQVRKAVDDADSFKQECTDLNKKVERLGGLLRRAARLSTNGSSSVFYEHPTRRIMEEAKKTLEKALALVRKCKKSGVLKRVITITSVTDFRKSNNSVDGSIEDLNWLLTVSAGGDDLGLPPIAANDPILALIWQHIARVQAGNPDERSDGASVLATLASDNERNGKIIIEEGGLVPLIKLLSDGTPSGQESAAKALGALAKDQQRAQEIVKAGAIQTFVHVLADAHVKVQTQAASALANIVSQDPEAQSAFGAAGAIRHLVTLLSFDSNEEQQTSSAASATTSVGRKQSSQTMHTVVQSSMAQNKTSPTKPSWIDDATAKPSKSAMKTRKIHSRSNESLNLENGKGYYTSSLREHRREREMEDPETIVKMKAQVAKAVWKLAANNIKNCKSITDTRALLCLAKMIEKESECDEDGEVRKNGVMAVMEIAAVAEQDQELRRAAFKMNSPSVKAVVEQLLKVIEEGENIPELQIPCIKAIGCINRIFSAKETHVVRPLTEQLGNRDTAVASEAAIALLKFTESENFLKAEHSRSVLESNGASHLVQLAIFDDHAKQHAVRLLCNLALNVVDHQALRSADTLKVLKETSSRNPHLMQIPSLRELLPKAIDHLELYQGSGSSHLEDDSFISY